MQIKKVEISMKNPETYQIWLGKLLFTLCIITNWITHLLWILISPSHLWITWITMTSCIWYTDRTMPALLTLTYIVLFILHYSFVHFLFSVCKPIHTIHAPHSYICHTLIIHMYLLPHMRAAVFIVHLWNLDNTVSHHQGKRETQVTGITQYLQARLLSFFNFACNKPIIFINFLSIFFQE